MSESHAAPRTPIAVCIDDYGLHSGVNDAAMRLAQAGRLSAISCMVGARSWQEGALALAELPRDRVDIGLHLDLTEHPLSPGMRRPLGALIALASARLLNRRGLRGEIEAQLDAFEQAVGHAPGHVDGHQHVHQFPQVRDTLLESLSRRYPQRKPWLRRTRRPDAMAGGIKARVIEQLGSTALDVACRERGFAQNTHLLGVYDFTGGAGHYRKLLTGWLAAASAGDLLMCHASTPCMSSDPIQAARRAEYEVLSSPGFGELLERSGVKITALGRIAATA